MACTIEVLSYQGKVQPGTFGSTEELDGAETSICEDLHLKEHNHQLVQIKNSVNIG